MGEEKVLYPFQSALKKQESEEIGEETLNPQEGVTA